MTAADKLSSFHALTNWIDLSDTPQEKLSVVPAYLSPHRRNTPWCHAAWVAWAAAWLHLKLHELALSSHSARWGESLAGAPAATKTFKNRHRLRRVVGREETAAAQVGCSTA